MSFKKPKLGIFLLVLAAVCVVLKLLISYLFPLSRLLLILLVPVTAICLIVFLVANRHTLKNGRVLACLLVPVLAGAFTFLSIDSQLEFARFHVTKGAYESSVQEVEKHSPPLEDNFDARSGSYDLKFPQSMLYPISNTVHYFKKGNSVAILFPASGSLCIFPVHYYGYFSDSTARDMIEHPKYYQCSWAEVDAIDELDGPHWGYVSW